MPRWILVIACTFVLVPATVVQAATASVEAHGTLRVGTKEVPPFAMRGPDGEWTGVSIELWREFARRKGLAFEIVEMDLPQLLASLEEGSLDAVAGALTITRVREEHFDFSHPFVSSGLALAVRPHEHGAIRPILARFLEEDFLRGLALGLIALTVTSLVVWWLEARRNPEQFGGGFAQGIGSALWWSVVTMTTVGYGDKAPRTAAARVVAVLWMIAGVILISGLTAAITSALTVSQLSSVRGLEDIGGQAIATVVDTRGEEFMRQRGLRTLPFASLDECVDALYAGRVAGIVYDEPVLQSFAIAHPERSLHVLPKLLERWGYGIGLPSGSQLREPLNRFLLGHLNTPAWQSVVARHLGS